MSDDESRYLDLLQQRTTLLQSLSEALRAARSAVVVCDISEFETLITQQEFLCQQIVQLDGELRMVRQKLAATGSMLELHKNQEWDEKLRGALERLRIAAENVKRESEGHLAVIRRSKRTVSALLNGFQTFEGNYQSLVHVGPANINGPGGSI